MNTLKQKEEEISKDGYNLTLAKICLKLEEIADEQSVLKDLFEQLNQEVISQTSTLEDAVLDAVKFNFNDELINQLEIIFSEHEKNINESCKKISSVFVMALNKNKQLTG